MVRRVTFAGKSKKVVLMVVSYFPFKLMNKFIPILFTGCHDVGNVSDVLRDESPKEEETQAES